MRRDLLDSVKKFNADKVSSLLKKERKSKTSDLNSGTQLERGAAIAA